jgi:anti-sigma factor ChrR (cupin superfamily)
MKHINVDAEPGESAALYALGAHSQHEARAFEEHLAEGCADCAAEADSFHSVVSALAFAAPELEPRPSAREKLLARLAHTAKPANPKVDVASFLTIRAGEGQWQAVCEGITVKTLFVDEQTGTVTSLFRFQPGAHTPRHFHAGVEQCLIIEGDFHANDEVFGPGDFTCAMAGSVHETTYTENGALVLIVANEGYTMSAPGRV